MSLSAAEQNADLEAIARRAIEEQGLLPDFSPEALAEAPLARNGDVQIDGQTPSGSERIPACAK